MPAQEAKSTIPTEGNPEAIAKIQGSTQTLKISVFIVNVFCGHTVVYKQYGVLRRCNLSRKPTLRQEVMDE